MNSEHPAQPRPWTLAAYTDICRSALDAGYQVQTVAAFLSEPAPRSLILRHDVDRFPNNALRMAHTEHDLGLKATYYFRMGRMSFQPAVISSIHSMGHEIGYHYEVLSRTGGDKMRAVELFERDLLLLRDLAPVVTASAHGSPMSKWDNRTFWNNAEPAAFGLIGDAYRNVDFSQVIYLTDTGRAWNNPISNLRDRVATKEIPDINNIESLLRFLRQDQISAICLQTHPERWNDSVLGTARSFILDYAANLIKLALRYLRRSDAQTNGG